MSKKPQYSRKKVNESHPGKEVHRDVREAGGQKSTHAHCAQHEITRWRLRLALVDRAQIHTTEL